MSVNMPASAAKVPGIGATPAPALDALAAAEPPDAFASLLQACTIDASDLPCANSDVHNAVTTDSGRHETRQKRLNDATFDPTVLQFFSTPPAPLPIAAQLGVPAPTQDGSERIVRGTSAAANGAQDVEAAQAAPVLADGTTDATPVNATAAALPATITAMLSSPENGFAVDALRSTGTVPGTAMHSASVAVDETHDAPVPARPPVKMVRPSAAPPSVSTKNTSAQTSSSSADVLMVPNAQPRSTPAALQINNHLASAFTTPHASNGTRDVVAGMEENAAPLQAPPADTTPQAAANDAPQLGIGVVVAAGSTAPPQSGAFDNSAPPQDDSGEQQTTERRGERASGRTSASSSEGAARFGLGGWLSTAQPANAAPANHGAAPASANNGMLQFTYDRVASDTSARRVTEALRSDMTFGVHTDAFGHVNVQTSLRGDQLLSQISLEQAHLHASALAAHMPSLEAELGTKYQLNASVTVGSQTASLSNSTSQQQHTADQHAQTRQTRTPVVSASTSVLQSAAAVRTAAPLQGSGALDLII